MNRKDTIVRVRKKYTHAYFAAIALRNEYRTAVVLVFLMNVLLMVVNYTDIRFVWLDFQPGNNSSLSQFVHEGTYLLILSILLSQGLIIYYFRGNLNFFKSNTLFRFLSNAWMFQNVILTVSVGVRNWHYIQHFALAYKRIGVFVFLCLVVFGLITMIVKINKRKTGYFLLRTNTWAAYAMMILISCFNWDQWIIQYNLKGGHKNGFDIDFCSELSDKTLPIVLANKATIELEMQNKLGMSAYSRKWMDMQEFDKELEGRARIFMYRYENYSWASWNWMDLWTYRELLKHYSKNSDVFFSPVSSELLL